MRLEPGAIRYVSWPWSVWRRIDWAVVSELHWHTTGEWAYILKGVAQISTVTPEGQNYVGTVVSFTIVQEGNATHATYSIAPRGPVVLPIRSAAQPTGDW